MLEVMFKWGVLIPLSLILWCVAITIVVTSVVGLTITIADKIDARKERKKNIY